MEDANLLKNGSRFAPIGWGLLILGLALMFLSLGTFFLYVPLFLAVFVLSVIAMTKGRVVHGVLLLLAVLVIPAVIGVGLFSYRLAATVEKNRLHREIEEQEKKRMRAERLSVLEFQEVSGYRDGAYMHCKGRVRNSGATGVSYVKVAVEWLDANGEILDTDWTYLVGSEELLPGAAKSFQIMTPQNRRMEKYRHYIMED